MYERAEGYNMVYIKKVIVEEGEEEKWYRTYLINRSELCRNALIMYIIFSSLYCIIYFIILKDSSIYLEENPSPT